MMLARDWKSFQRGASAGASLKCKLGKRSSFVYARLYIVCLSVHSSSFPFIYTSLYIGFGRTLVVRSSAKILCIVLSSSVGELY